MSQIIKGSALQFHRRPAKRLRFCRTEMQYFAITLTKINFHELIFLQCCYGWVMGG